MLTLSKDCLQALSQLPVSTLTGKPVIHFSHANGMPSRVYEPLFTQLSTWFTVEYIPVLGVDELGIEAYPIDNHWQALTRQVIDKIQAAKRKHGIPIIGWGHSLGALCTLQAMYKRPDLFAQAVLMDPPIIYGHYSLIWHLAKFASPSAVDKISPAGISKHRRDTWNSRDEARESLESKAFFKNFDPRTFDGYLQHGLADTADGKVTLTIPKVAEVAVFRTNPSMFWLKPNKSPKRPVTLLIGNDSQFLHKGFPQKVEKRLSIPFKVHSGGHMFPLEHPESVVKMVIETIAEQSV